jgi:hypothetical protein
MSWKFENSAEKKEDRREEKQLSGGDMFKKDK